jgi:Protein of unknown function (DUF2997)
LNKTIEITVGPTGETKVETKGFSGPECRIASQFVEQALGKQTSEQLKGGFYNSQDFSNDLRQSS